MNVIVHQLAFYLHVTAGSIALITFWLPLLTAKGSEKHRRFGRYFTTSMYTVAIMGFIMTILVLVDPIGIRFPDRNFELADAAQVAKQNRLFAGFLFMLSLLVFNSVKHGMLVLEAKSNRQLLKTASHLTAHVLQGLTAIVMGWLGLAESVLLFQIFAVVCLLNVVGNLHYIFKPTLKNREWIIPHLSSLIGAGIGAYTAFFAFGGSRLLQWFIGSDNYLIFWILPSIVGVAGTLYYSKKYRKQFKVV